MMNLKFFIETFGDGFPYPVTMVNQDLPDQPLVYVNEYFLNFTGYQKQEILGKNCRLLQADKTSDDARMKIRDAINSRLPVCQDLLNSKKNGEHFYNRLVLIPFRTGHEKYFLGLQHVIPVEKFSPFHDVPHNDLMDRTINPLSILVGLEHSEDARFHDEFQKMIGKIQSFVLGL